MPQSRPTVFYEEGVVSRFLGNRKLWVESVFSVARSVYDTQVLQLRQPWRADSSRM
jgi:hypothetical protein